LSLSVYHQPQPFVPVHPCVSALGAGPWCLVSLWTRSIKLPNDCHYL